MIPVTNAEIDALLDRARPDRYDVDDHAWRDPVVAAIATRIPPRQAAQVAAERLVADREGRATRSANELLRRVGKERQWPLPDMADDLADRPISVGSERVCLRAATSLDLRTWAIDERRDAAQEFAARSMACDGAEWLADEMDAKGLGQFADAYAPGNAA